MKEQKKGEWEVQFFPIAKTLLKTIPPSVNTKVKFHTTFTKPLTLPAKPNYGLKTAQTGLKGKQCCHIRARVNQKEKHH